MGGAPWKPTIYSNLISTSMEMFDLIDIQRIRHPKLRKFTYESKSLRLKSRIDFFLIAKDLSVNIKKSEILPAIPPDHNAISISLTLPNKCPRGPGFWKFNNTLLRDPQYIDKIHCTYTLACKYYGHLTDRRLFWEMIKMEIRSATITYSKNKSKSIRNREQELIRKLDHLDGTICNNFSSPLIDGVLREYDELIKHVFISLSIMSSYLYQTCLHIFIKHVFVFLSNMSSYLYQICLYVIYQQRVRGFYQGFQTPRNR